MLHEDKPPDFLKGSDSVGIRVLLHLKFTNVQILIC